MAHRVCEAVATAADDRDTADGDDAAEYGLQWCDCKAERCGSCCECCKLPWTDLVSKNACNDLTCELVAIAAARSCVDDTGRNRFRPMAYY